MVTICGPRGHTKMNTIYQSEATYSLVWQNATTFLKLQRVYSRADATMVTCRLMPNIVWQIVPRLRPCWSTVYCQIEHVFAHMVAAAYLGVSKWTNSAPKCYEATPNFLTWKYTMQFILRKVLGRSESDRSPYKRTARSTNIRITHYNYSPKRGGANGGGGRWGGNFFMEWRNGMVGVCM